MQKKGETQHNVLEKLAFIIKKTLNLTPPYQKNTSCFPPFFDFGVAIKPKVVKVISL